MTTFTVIENTPGYLPDADEPATFDTFPDALIHASQLAEEIIEGIVEAGGIPNMRYGAVQYLQSDRVVRILDTTREHDLGRVVEIIEGDDA